MTSLEKVLSRKLQLFRASTTGLSAVEVAPSLQIAAFHRGQPVCKLITGSEYQFYDWASLTKPVFTVSALMFSQAKESHQLFSNTWPLGLTRPLSSILPDFGIWAEKTTSADLLTHSAGLTWWVPFFKELPLPTDSSCSVVERWDLLVRLLRERIRSLSPSEQNRSVYSDLDFLVLGEVLCRVFDRPLLDIWEALQARLNLQTVFFSGLNSHLYQSRPGQKQMTEIAPLTAPTEFDDAYRKRLLRGEVHDENAASLGGVAPHSGLFGTMEDLIQYALQIRKLYCQFPSAFPSEGRRFLLRSIPKELGDWALGFMMPSQVGSTAGHRFSPSSIGHTGFTGTSFWFDPVQDLLVCILSNRVHPTREKRGFEELRPAIHDWIAEHI